MPRAIENRGASEVDSVCGKSAVLGRLDRKSLCEIADDLLRVAEINLAVAVLVGELYGIAVNEVVAVAVILDDRRLAVVADRHYVIPERSPLHEEFGVAVKDRRE